MHVTYRGLLTLGRNTRKEIVLRKQVVIRHIIKRKKWGLGSHTALQFRGKKGKNSFTCRNGRRQRLAVNWIRQSEEKNEAHTKKPKIILKFVVYHSK